MHGLLGRTYLPCSETYEFRILQPWEVAHRFLYDSGHVGNQDHIWGRLGAGVMNVFVLDLQMLYVLFDALHSQLGCCIC